MIEITKNSKLFAQYIDLSTETKFQYGDECDIVALKFDSDIEKSKNELIKILPGISKPIMICGCGKDEVDSILLPELIQLLDRECIISFVTEKTYKDIIPIIIEGGHYAVLKTPIDINIAKELNILSLDMGLDPKKIIMNTDIGGLGYGYEYGYSIIEKICLETGDEYLNFPIISDAAIESSKTKEYKNNSERAKLIELGAVSGVIAAGANIFTVVFPDNIPVLKEIV